jgi:hypothetical protein
MNPDREAVGWTLIKEAMKQGWVGPVLGTVCRSGKTRGIILA